MTRSWIAAALAVLVAAGASAYPIDLYEETGINRLEAYTLARATLMERGTLPPGAVWPSERVELRLDDRDLALPEPDPDFTARVRELLGEDAAGYGVAVLDLTDPADPHYAEVNATTVQNPGSVGKILVLLGWFQALADVYPDDLDARRRVLRDTVVTADAFIRKDSHKVPFWKPGAPKVSWRPIEEGDSGNLWTWLDWMASASSNAAASMMIQQLMLLRHFGGDYPVSQERAKAFLAGTPKDELQQLIFESLLDPLDRNALDRERLRQGSFFTREAKQRVPGTNSVATARELMRFMLLLERGDLVDHWSSLEIKRLLYLTDSRIRYASSPALTDAAVFYKSGSLYSCKPEPGFTCRKYHGNVINYLNSIAIVEERRSDVYMHYLVAVLSNVLRKDSAEEHRSLAQGLHALIAARHGVARPETDTAEPAGAAPEPPGGS